MVRLTKILSWVILALAISWIAWPKLYSKYLGYKIRNATAEDILSHKSSSYNSWEGFEKTPLNERIGFGTIKNEYWVSLAMPGYFPTDVDLEGEGSQFLEKFFAGYFLALESLPQGMIALLEQKLVKVIPVTDLGVSGLMSSVFKHGREVAGIVVIDISRLHRPVNEWFWMTEARGFTQNCNIVPTLNLTNPKIDPIISAFAYTILHELFHVIAIGSNVHAPYAYRDRSGSYTWTPLSWQFNGKGFVLRTVPSEAFSKLRLDGSEDHGSDCKSIPAVQKELQKTDFVDLYASQSPSEDFAESFANYIYVKRMGHHFDISVTVDGIQSFVPKCWDTPRCDSKQRYIENFLNPKISH